MPTEEFDFPEVSDGHQLAANSTLQLEKLQLPEWQQSVYVTELTAGEVDEWRSEMFEVDGSDYTYNFAKQNLRLAALASRRRDGSRLYPDTAQGVEYLRGKGSAGVERIAAVAKRLSKLNNFSKKELEGKSGTVRTSSSKDVSPSPSVSLGS